MRIFAFADLHLDYATNLRDIHALSDTAYREDALLLAGDVTDDLRLLEETLVTLREKFARVFYVPGNHELWDRRREHGHALLRFEAILELADAARVDCAPARLHGTWGAVWVVPLFSWYRRPDEGVSSLFLPKHSEHPRQRWADDRFVRWPDTLNARPADYFMALNEPHIRAFSEPVISFSHFLPRRELMFKAPGATRVSGLRDPHPGFNFSRVAGCSLLDAQIRRLGSQLHVYGHQHRNRDISIEGVRYVSHCMGYPRERVNGYLQPNAMAPICVWRCNEHIQYATG
jgi:predicted phosphodiesterase